MNNDPHENPIKKDINKGIAWLWDKMPVWMKIIIGILIVSAVIVSVLLRIAKDAKDVVERPKSEFGPTIVPSPTSIPNVLGCNAEWKICSNFNDGKWGITRDGKWENDAQKLFVIQNPDEQNRISAPIKGSKRGAMMYYEEKVIPNNQFMLKIKPYGNTYLGLVIFEYGHVVRCILGDGDRRVLRCFSQINDEWIKKLEKYLPYGEALQPGVEIEVEITTKMLSKNTVSVDILLRYIFSNQEKMFTLQGDIPLPILLNEREKREIGIGLVDSQQKGDVEAEFIQFNIRY